MSLATFKKKSINLYSTATKISGIPTNQYWIYQGPYGRKTSLASTILAKSLIGPDGQTGGEYNASNAGFSLNGVYRNVGPVGESMKFSQSYTPYRGIYPRGCGGTRGRYPSGPDNVVLNIQPVLSKVGDSTSYVKPSVLSNRGMLARRFRWINSGKYPNYWVQPEYTGNQTDSASQGLYTHTKSAQSDCVVDTNDVAKYVGNIKFGGSSGCETTPARGYTFNIQQSNAPYTKFLHIPQSSSQRTLRVQRQCVNPIGPQKPFPYAVQNGTGIIPSGISISNVGNACNTSDVYLTPPSWYTALTPGEKAALIARNKGLINGKTANEINRLVFTDIVLNGTSNT